MTIHGLGVDVFTDSFPEVLLVHLNIVNPFTAKGSPFDE